MLVGLVRSVCALAHRIAFLERIALWRLSFNVTPEMYLQWRCVATATAICNAKLFLQSEPTLCSCLSCGMLYTQFNCGCKTAFQRNSFTSIRCDLHMWEILFSVFSCRLIVKICHITLKSLPSKKCVGPSSIMCSLGRWELIKTPWL